MEHGHKHFKTHSHELFWEHLHDTKCLMAWGDDAVVLAFRGTASMANARADLQVGAEGAWEAAWSRACRA